MMTRSDAARATTGSAGMLAVRRTSTWPPALLLLLEGGSSAGGAGAPAGRTANDGSDAALWNADGASFGAAPCAPAPLTGRHALPGRGVQGSGTRTCRVRLSASCGLAPATRTLRCSHTVYARSQHRVWREHKRSTQAARSLRLPDDATQLWYVVSRAAQRALYTDSPTHPIRTHTCS